MNIETIKEGEDVLVMIIRGGESWDKGLNFISSEKDYQQVGFWNYDKGQILKGHIHLVAPREALKTQEVIVVKQGRLRADVYTSEEKFLQSVELQAGDIGVFLHGGHGYEILEDSTLVLEVKNGPYVGPEKDRKRI